MSDKKTVTSTADAPRSHRQQMLDILHKADVWHELQKRKGFSAKTRVMHSDFQRAIWWAIENLESTSNG